MAKTKGFKYSVFLLLGLLASALSYAQHGNVSATIAIDSTQLMIGEQSLLHIELSYDKGTHVVLPAFADTLVTGVEVVQTGQCDTLELGNNRVQVNQDLLITSFDEGLYHINPLPFAVGNDTIYSNGVGLKVLTYQIDSTDTRFFDIKPVIAPEFVWADYHPYLVILLAILFFIVASLYAYKQWKQNKSLLGSFKKEEPKLPPFTLAMNELERIKAEKLWQHGREKEYYTQMTEVLRVYMEERFELNAMEMTSGEILEQVKRVPEAREVFDSLKQILELADFVKFAKMKPMDYENESSLMSALFFVQKTKPAEAEISVEAEQKEGAAETQEPNKTTN